MLSSAAVIALAGTALGIEPTLQPVTHGATVHASSATPVQVDAHGRVISWGETIQLDGNAERGMCEEGLPVFDSIGLADTDGDGHYSDPVCGDVCGLTSPSSRWNYGGATPFQGFAVDFTTSPAPGRLLSELTVPGVIGRCDGSQAEQFQIFVSVYDDIDTTGAGYDTDGDTIADSPFPPDDLDGNGVPDAFLGGVVLSYSPVPDFAGGYSLFLASGLESFEIELPADGVGAVRIMYISGFSDQDGDTIPESPEPFELASPLLWGPTNSVPGCPFTGPANSSSGNVWALGYDVCLDEPSTSPDPYTFVFESLVGLVPCPDLLMPSFALYGTCPTGRLCADQNNDGLLLPTDFTAWIANFNANDPIADVNQDNAVTPTDFTAWVGAFNQGINGPICNP